MTFRDEVYAALHTRMDVYEVFGTFDLSVATSPARRRGYGFAATLDAERTASVNFTPILTGDWGRSKLFYGRVPVEVHTEVTAVAFDGNLGAVALPAPQLEKLAVAFLRKARVDFTLEAYQRMAENDTMNTLRVHLASDLEMELTVLVDRHANLQPGANPLPTIYGAMAEALAHGTDHIAPFTEMRDLWLDKLMPVFEGVMNGREPTTRHRLGDAQRMVLIPPPAVGVGLPRGVTFYRPRSRSADLDNLFSTGRLSDQPTTVPAPLQPPRVVPHGSLKRKMIL